MEEGDVGGAGKKDQVIGDGAKDNGTDIDAVMDEDEEEPLHRYRHTRARQKMTPRDGRKKLPTLPEVIGVASKDHHDVEGDRV